MGRGSGAGGRSGEDKCVKWSVGLLVGAAVITGVILIAVSFSSLEPNEVGLRYNRVAQEIEDKELFTSGRHFIGPGHTFVRYTTAVQTVKFNTDFDADAGPITARTQDGLTVTLGFSFNYRLREELTELFNLYHSYGEMGDVSVFYNRLARNVVREVASEFTAFSMITNRTAAQVRMLEDLSQEISESHGSVDSVQLLEVSLPARFEDARVRLETASQDAEQARAERANSEQQAANDIRAAGVAASSIINRAEADAESTRLQASAIADSLAARLAANRAAYATVKSQLGLSEEQLLAYIYLQSLREAGDGDRAPRTVVYNAGAEGSLDLTPLHA